MKKLISYALIVAMIVVSCLTVKVVKADEITVTFDSKGGSEVASQTIEAGTKAKLPASPTKEGYFFAGWAVEEDAIIDPNTGECVVDSDGYCVDDFFDFFYYAIDESTTFYANWVKVYNITFDLGELGDPVVVQIPAGHYIYDEYSYVSSKYMPLTADGNIITGIYYDPDYNEFVDEWETAQADTTYYLTFEPYEYIIDEVELNAEMPQAGDEATIETDSDGYPRWSTSDPKPDFNISEDENYYEDGIYWITGFDGVDYNNPFTGTFEAGEDYYLEVYLESTGDYVFASDGNYTINGEQATIIRNDLSSISLGYILRIPDVYEILDGADQTINRGEDLTVRSSGKLRRFESILIDETEVPEEYLEISEGSVIATVKSDYLDTLAAGTHTLTYIFIDGEISTDFTINEPEKEEEPKEETAVVIETTPEVVANANVVTTATSTNPQTGDNVYFSAAMIVISAFGMIALIPRKKYNN